MNKTQSNKLSVSFDCIIEDLGLPIICAHLDDYTFNFLLDSGSTHNMIRTDVVEELGDMISAKEGESECWGLDNIAHRGKFYELNFEIQKQEFKETFLTSPVNEALNFPLNDHQYIKVHGILGVSFFTRNHIILNFSENKMHTTH